EGARIGCSISASRKCKRPWWRTLFGGATIDFSERERCEEREMSACLAASIQSCLKFANDKCSIPFRDARISLIDQMEVSKYISHAHLKSAARSNSSQSNVSQHLLSLCSLEWIENCRLTAGLGFVISALPILSEGRGCRDTQNCGFEEEVVEERSNVEHIKNDEVEVDKEENLVDEIPEKDEVSAIELNLEKQDFILERDESIEVAASCEEEEVLIEVEAVYGEDCKVIERFPPHFQLHIKPRTADDSSLQFVEAFLELRAGSQHTCTQYPKVPPHIGIIDSKGLDEGNLIVVYL
ncbi:E3 ubiquitin-protein ligase rnf25, partial [Thalictrum thalictroides]